MANTMIVSNGGTKPTTSVLVPYELGYSKASNDKNLYINDNGTIRVAVDVNNISGNVKVSGNFESTGTIKGTTITGTGLTVNGNATVSGLTKTGTFESTGNTTVKGLLIQEKGNYVWRTSTTGAGYFKIASIKITGTYMNSPIEITYSQREKLVTRITILFQSVNSIDPTLTSFTAFGGNFKDAYLHKVSMSSWDLYIRKVEAYDEVGILDLNMSHYGRDRVTITWKTDTIASLPSGCVTASWADFNAGGITAAGISASSVTTSGGITADGAVTANSTLTVSGMATLGDATLGGYPAMSHLYYKTYSSNTYPTSQTFLEAVLDDIPQINGVYGIGCAWQGKEYIWGIALVCGGGNYKNLWLTGFKKGTLMAKWANGTYIYHEDNAPS